MFSKLKAGLQKAGKEMKDGFEKAGHKIKKGTDEANKSSNDSRSHYATPEKKKSGLKHSTTSTRDNKSENTVHTTVASEKESEKILFSRQESHQSVRRPSSVHSDKSSRASLHGTVMPEDALTALRSRASTPVSVPPPSPPPPVETPKRTSEKSTPADTPPAPAARQATPLKLSCTPSVESSNSPRFSEADESEMETPGSIQFTAEPGSAPEKHPASPKALAAAPPLSILKESKLEEPKHDDKEDDLTTESSLDIEVVEDDDAPAQTEDFVEEVTPAPPDTKKGKRAKKEKGGAEEETLPARAMGKKAGASRKSAKEAVEVEVESKVSTRETAASKDVRGRGRGGNDNEPTPLCSPSTAANNDTDEKEVSKKKPTAVRGTKAAVTFAEDALDPPAETKKRNKVMEREPRQTAKRTSNTVIRSDYDSADNEIDDTHRDVRKTESLPTASPAFDQNSRSEDDKNLEDTHAGRKADRRQRRHRDLHFSSAREDGDVATRENDEGRDKEQDVDRKKGNHTSASQPDHSRELPARCDVSRERCMQTPHLRSEGGKGECHVHTGRRVAAAGETAKDHSEPRHSSVGLHRREERSDDDDEGRRSHCRDGLGERTGRNEWSPAAPIASSTVRRRGSTRRTPLRSLDGGALVEECLRSVEAYPNKPVQRRSAVQSTYQLEYSDWSRYRDGDHHGGDHYDDGVNATSGDGEYRPDGYGSRSGSFRRNSQRRGSGISSFHRLSLYDEDDALAADAVAAPEHFRAHSTARRHSCSGRRWDEDSYGYGYGSGGEQAMSCYSSSNNVEGRGLFANRSHHCVSLRLPSAGVSVDEERREGRGDEEGWNGRQRAYDVAGRRPLVETSGCGATPPITNTSSSSYYRQRGVENVTPTSKRSRYNAPRPRSPPHATSSHSPSQYRGTPVERTHEEDRRASEAWHRLTEDRTDPDYYYSDALEVREDGSSWHSRSRGSPFAPSPPRSPLWAHRSSFSRTAVEVSPNLNRLQRSEDGLCTTLSPLRGRRRAGNATRCHSRSEALMTNNRQSSNMSGRNNTSALHASASRLDSARSEEDILEEVEWKLDVLGQQILEEDLYRERAMLSSPFERLYHLNNRRDRDERRQKVFQLNRLERIRDRIVSGSLEEDIARREERLRKQEEMLTNPNGVFLRLYQNTSGRRSKVAGQSTIEGEGEVSSRHSTPQQRSSLTGGATSPNATTSSVKASSRPNSTTRRTLSREQRLALCDRLYGGALTGKSKKDERIRQTAEERRQHEVEELLIARLVAQLQLQHSRLHPRDKKPPLTLAELEKEAQRQLEKMRQEDPKGYQEKLLRGLVLSAKEQSLMSARLWKQGYVSKENLAMRKAQDELRGCTFQPKVNDYAAFGSLIHKRGDEKAKCEDERSEKSDQGEASSSKEGAERHTLRKEADRCKELYRKGTKAKAREAELRNERDREARLQILRGRMASDHHFRRRVELDPSLAERFMKSLVV